MLHPCWIKLSKGTKLPLLAESPLRLFASILRVNHAVERRTGAERFTRLDFEVVRSNRTPASHRWRKFSYRNNGGADCVEVSLSTEPESVLVRDTRDRSDSILRFSPAT